MGRYKLTDEEKIERRKISNAKYYSSNKDKYAAIHKKHEPKQKEKRSSYEKQRRSSDPLFKLSSNVRTAIHHSLKNKGYSKASSSKNILGCTWEEFKQHIESQFEPWMTWENRGGKVASGPNVTWDLDHIIPISSAVNEEDIIRLNHYTNFQPLCSYHNRFVKRDKY
jgi:hypothetical protein